MTQDVFVTLLATWEVWRSAFTAPAMRLSLIWATGWLMTSGTHAVTQALVATGTAGRRHHEAFHRFFSRGTWHPDKVGLALLERVIELLVPADQPLRFVIDDTLAQKKGAHVFGIGNHVDAVRSTKKMRVFAFGHVWVVLAVLVQVPFSSRTWALPVLLRLYRNKKDFLDKASAKTSPKSALPPGYKRKTDLAREMLDVLVARFRGRRLELAMDSAYCNDTVLRGLPDNVVVFGAMRPDAVLTELPSSGETRRGRPAKRGQLLPKPTQLASDTGVPWRKVTTRLYGKEQTLRFKTLKAQWYIACRERLLRIVVVRVDSGRIGLRVFFCTDASLDAEQVLTGYAKRWNIECAFKDLKQHLGFADSAARKPAAVERVAPLVAFLYTSLVVWFADGVHELSIARPPLRPWYTCKRNFSFLDIIQTAQRAVASRGFCDPGCDYDNLQKLIAARLVPSCTKHPSPDAVKKDAA